MPDMYLDVDAAVTVPVNLLPLTDDTDFKSIEEAFAYNAAGMDLNWNFVTSAGVITQTNVTPTTAGLHDWTHVGNGMYKIEIPASGGTINNDTEGYGWFSGVCTGVLPWVSPRIGFRSAALNDALCDSAYSATRGLAGTALPAAAADAAGGLPISDAGGLDLDTQLANTHEITAARMGALTDWIDGGRLDLLLDAIPTTAMRGTDNAALASLVTAARMGALTDWIDGGRLDLLLDFLKNVAEGDRTIDTEQTPYQGVVKIKSTDTELIRKDLKQADGTNVTSTDHLVGQEVEPA